MFHLHSSFNPLTVSCFARDDQCTFLDFLSSRQAIQTDFFLDIPELDIS